MKILLISSYIFGYMDFAVEEMKLQGHEVDVLYYENDPLQFQYNNILHKATSGIGKLVGKNAKKNAREKALKTFLKDKTYDFTLMIHGQYLNDATHQFLKSISKRYVAYFFDSLTKMPDQKKIAHHFDKVFSYEPMDCKSEGYDFITNFIPSTDFKSDHYSYDIFNIGGIDSRFHHTQALAAYLKQHHITFKFMLFNETEYTHFEKVKTKMTVEQVLPFIKDCKIMLDMQRENQNGLTFRVFEALGNDKKLITTNQEIKNYDFYNPQNIYLLDLKNLQIPKEFLEQKYQPISEEIVHKYTVSSWVKKIMA